MPNNVICKSANVSHRLEYFEKILRSRLEVLQKHISELRAEMQGDNEVDDDAHQATRSAAREIIMLTIERESKNISEIEQALLRMDKNAYGFCSACEEEIPLKRLKAIPWTRLCVDCAGGGFRRNVSADSLFGKAAWESPVG